MAADNSGYAQVWAPRYCSAVHDECSSYSNVPPDASGHDIISAGKPDYVPLDA